jgi:hypothetical protein
MCRRALATGLGQASVDVSSAIEMPIQQARWQLSIGRSTLNDALMQLE